MKLAVGLALLICALLAAVVWVLARPRWRWERPTVDKVEVSDNALRTYSTGSPWSVTSRLFGNGSDEGLFV